jgi:aspartyl-tRNA(Asn)/glutamyl-tRNA(Gln) amidotransferase subunit C
MSLSEQQVKEIAYLARLSVDDGEVEQTTTELNNILGLMADLAKIDTEGVSPMAHPLNMSQRLREDEVSEVDQSEAFQAIAPQTGQSHFLVPTVIE